MIFFLTIIFEKKKDEIIQENIKENIFLNKEFKVQNIFENVFNNKSCLSLKKSLERKIFFQVEKNRESVNYLTSFKINLNQKKRNQNIILLENLNLYNDILNFENKCKKNFFYGIYYTENLKNNKQYLIIKEFTRNLEEKNTTFLITLEEDEDFKEIYEIVTKKFNISLEEITLNKKKYKTLSLKDLEKIKKEFKND